MTITKKFWNFPTLGKDKQTIKKKKTFLGVGLAVKDVSRLPYRNPKLIVPHIPNSCACLENSC